MEEKNKWKKEYINYLFCENEDMSSKANDLLEKNKPKRLFKYKYIEKNDEYTLDNVAHNLTVFTNPKYFNDPYDSILSLDEGAIFHMIRKEFPNESEEVLKELFNKHYKKNKDLIETAMQENDLYLDGMNVSCFSERNDSILMWSHYAHYHEGFCLEYDFDEIKEMYSEELYPVIYQDEIFCAIQSERNLTIEEQIITKYIDWSYENEWRIVHYGIDFYKKINEHSALFRMPKPTGIYIGCKMNEENKKKIKLLCIEENIKLYEMNMEYNEFKLKAREI